MASHEEPEEGAPRQPRAPWLAEHTRNAEQAKRLPNVRSIDKTPPDQGLYEMGGD
jgi:hypothetical protein